MLANGPCPLNLCQSISVRVCAAMPTAQLVLGLPSYVFGVGLMFWVFQLATLTGFIKFWQFGRQRNDIFGAVRFLRWAFRYRVLKLGSNNVYRGQCVFLANHRGWADFFVDMYVIGARGIPLSRRAVGMAFPAFTSSLLALKSIILFNRSNIKDTERFNSWLDRQLSRTAQNCLLVYPEGSRSQLTRSLPLKRGMLRYAFTRRLPVQCVITAHKEEVLNERRMWAHFGRTLVTGCSDVLESSRFDDFEAFMAAVQQLWDAQWEAVHLAPRHGLPELSGPVAAGGDYTPPMLAQQTAALAFWLAVLVLGTRLLLRWLASAAALLPGGQLFMGGLAVYCVVSLVAAALLPPPVKSGRQATGGMGAAAASISGSVPGWKEPATVSKEE